MRGTGGSFRIRFYGYEEDAEICINIFNYAVKVVRRRFVTLRAIYAEAGKNFRRNEKMNYIAGFCQGLDRNFEEQKKQSQSFALALATPQAVIDFVDTIPGIENGSWRGFEGNRGQMNIFVSVLMIGAVFIFVSMPIFTFFRSASG